MTSKQSVTRSLWFGMLCGFITLTKYVRKEAEGRGASPAHGSQLRGEGLLLTVLGPLCRVTQSHSSLGGGEARIPWQGVFQTRDVYFVAIEKHREKKVLEFVPHIYSSKNIYPSKAPLSCEFLSGLVLWGSQNPHSPIGLHALIIFQPDRILWLRPLQIDRTIRFLLGV